MEALAQTLYDNGVAVLTIIEEQAAVDAWRERIEQEILAGPEVAEGVERVSDLQGGSFKALGTPTSFHGAAVRELRTHVAQKIGAFIAALSEVTEQRNAEILFDRYRHQPKGTKVGSEKYHRDESTHALPDDVILGGWLNLSADGFEQHFSYLEGTQLRSNKKRGHSKARPTSEQLSKARKIDIAPGQLVFFYQNILHQVHGSKLAGDSVRLHYGLRLTESEEPLFDLSAAFEQFAPPKIPSGQDPHMWPKLYWVNHVHKLREVSANFRAEVLKTKKRKQEDMTFVPRVLELPEGMRGNFAAYEDEERALYKPKRARADQ